MHDDRKKDLGQTNLLLTVSLETSYFVKKKSYSVGDGIPVFTYIPFTRSSWLDKLTMLAGRASSMFD